ncbi:hypothetical protein [Microbacterium sp. SORGH_AS_0888]|uniref:hypothetical protein n=1 Tax=Microbacterium sp. SORGH_AS_0888 TaxID=3041791 RepID=UPI00278390C0|nr:hypothetical protein [Microbacterium sp. SORGH_AS_0888]MDQ1130604.1 hypothetical protein [Microbacterium sp. SORGH_AS_0888]
MADTRDEPVMDQHDATDGDKLDGIIQQVRADVGHKGERRIAEVLRQRLAQAGVAYDDALVADAVARVRG